MICSNKECSRDFEPKTHNQKYCSDECCRVATNRRIMEKYYEKKAIRNGAFRQCTKCKTKLSRYNQGNLCSTCEKKVNVTNRGKLLGMINEVSGTDKD
jgi:hypothetical protein